MKSRWTLFLLLVVVLCLPLSVNAQEQPEKPAGERPKKTEADPKTGEKAGDQPRDPVSPTEPPKEKPAEKPEPVKPTTPDKKAPAKTPGDEPSKSPEPKDKPPVKDSPNPEGPKPPAGTDPTTGQPKKPADLEKLSEAEARRRAEALKTLYELLERDREDIERLQEEQQLASPETKEELIEEIRQEEKRIGAHRDRINSIATGVDMSLFRDDPDKALDWQKEAIQFVKPFVNMVKSATKKPREIERQRSELAHYTELQPIVSGAIENIETLRRSVTDPKLKSRLDKLKAEWVERDEEIRQHIAVSRQVLKDLTKDKRSFIESSSEIIKYFFRSRGRNLLFSILAFVIIFITMRLFHRRVIQSLGMYKSDKRPFYVRLIDVIYHITTVVLSLGGTVVMMYISGDWLLLSVIILFLLGVFWAARQTLPHYWIQIRTLLNIGSIRENERVVYNGLPYRVVRLNLDTILENPDLDNCRIRLPLKDVVGFISRPVSDSEPWFPCRSKDWVRLDDSVYGQVLHQTQDLVQLQLAGGSLKTYQTADFLAKNPTNLSCGFRISSTFGVDYGLQDKIAEEVPNNMAEFIRNQMDRAGYAQFMMMLAVEFASANSSSLDLLITVDMAGKAAPHYFNISRALQRFAVMACNEYGYGIPYPHVVVQTHLETPVNVNLPRPTTKAAGRGTTARRPTSGNLSEGRVEPKNGGFRTPPTPPAPGPGPHTG